VTVAVDRQPSATRVAGVGAVPLQVSSRDAEDEGGQLSAISPLILLSFAASALLLALAALPPAWSVRYGSLARLVDLRVGMAMAGAIILVESVVVTLMLS
jgi:hypothetical protein